MGTREIMAAFKKVHAKKLGLNLGRPEVQIGTVFKEAGLDRDFIRSEIEQMGITQSEAARRIGMSVRGIEHILSGSVKVPRIATLRMIAKFLNVPVGRLFTEGN